MLSVEEVRERWHKRVNKKGYKRNSIVMKCKQERVSDKKVKILEGDVNTIVKTAGIKSGR